MLSAISKIFPKALKKKICEKRLSSIETLPTQSARLLYEKTFKNYKAK